MAAPSAFPTTRWTLVLACRGDPERRREALAPLLQAYWQPLYVSLRKQGHPRAAAEDLVQSFAVRLLETDALARVEPGRGKLRGYLKTALKHHAGHVREKEQAQKRGGGLGVSLDADAVEGLLAAGPETPDAAFDHAWARATFDAALTRLLAEHDAGGKAGPVEVIRAYFQGGADVPYATVAAQHGLSVPQLKSLLHRARARFRALLLEEVAQTVTDPAEAERELAELQRCL